MQRMRSKATRFTMKTRTLMRTIVIPEVSILLRIKRTVNHTTVRVRKMKKQVIVLLNNPSISLWTRKHHSRVWTLWYWWNTPKERHYEKWSTRVAQLAFIARWSTSYSNNWCKHWNTSTQKAWFTVTSSLRTFLSTQTQAGYKLGILALPRGWKPCKMLQRD